jgi:hypothetical protein
MALTPLWKIRSGQFAGWHSNDTLYDAQGRHVGYLAGHFAYSLTGNLLGEIYQGEWIGRRTAAAALQGETRTPTEAIAHDRLPDRAGLALDGWIDPPL